MALLSETTKAEALGSPPTTAPSAWQAWRYRLKVALREPTTLIGVLTALLFTYLIVVPIISIILDAVRVQFGHERRLGKDVGDLTLYYLDRAFFFARRIGSFLASALQYVDRRIRGDCTFARHRHRSCLAYQQNGHVRPPLVRHGLDRALYAAGLDLRARLDDVV